MRIDQLIAGMKCKLNVNKLPKQCVDIVPEQLKPIAKEIKALIDAGEDVPGCWVEQAVGVRVC